MIIITNITHIKFIKVLDKLYRVTDISLSDMSISASECENPASAAAKDVFLLEELQEFHITLYNKHEKPNITDFSEWKSSIIGNEIRLSYLRQMYIDNWILAVEDNH